METITDSLRSRRGSLEHNLVDLLAWLGFRVRLTLEQRLLRSKDGSGIWRCRDSTQIMEVKIPHRLTR